MGTEGGGWHAAKVPPPLKKVFVRTIFGPMASDSSLLKAKTSSTEMGQWGVASFRCMRRLLRASSQLEHNTELVVPHPALWDSFNEIKLLLLIWCILVDVDRWPDMLPYLLRVGESSSPHVIDSPFQPEFYCGPSEPGHVSLLQRPVHCCVYGQYVLPGIIDGQVSESGHELHLVL